MVIKGLFHSIIISLGILGATSCVGSLDTPVMSEPEPAMVNLKFTVETDEVPENAHSSRATVVTEPDEKNKFELATLDCEKIKTLRVIIVRHVGSNRIVEENRKIDLDEPKRYVGAGNTTKGELEYEVRSNEYKTIYLIANEDLIGKDNLKILTEELAVSPNGPEKVYHPGTFENMIYSSSPSGLLIDNSNKENPDYIPMTESYTIFVPDAAELTKGEDGKKNFNVGRLFVTRAAVKFTFEITNDTNSDLTLNNLIIVNGIPNKEYLFPNNTIYFPEKPIFPDYSQENITGRFITSFDVPSDVDYKPYVFTFGKNTISLPKNEATTPPTGKLYFCESKFLPKDNAPQPYALSMSVSNSAGDLMEFGPASLTNLPIIPRNTHVLVKILLKANIVNCEVALVPYIGVYLNPGFGI